MLKIKHINGEREIPGRQKVVRWSDISVLTSHAGLNLRSCTALSLTASFVSPYGLCYEREARVINGEREIPGRQKVVRGSNVQVLTSHAGLNPRSKHASLSPLRLRLTASTRLGYKREARVIKKIKSVKKGAKNAKLSN